ncbi:metallophosphoesterase family protein [Rhizobium sp. NPDC090275]|uniref:metallophosphoesterase family protein n=1 Tax=Rhizobium sp. NPDC090275 TaxID=3364498 RepID=UPI00383B68CD
MIYFTGDTHFGDRRVLSLDRRPFSSMAEHDAALIRNWNETVGAVDEVWHLGDVMSARAGDCTELLAQLNGRKHLIVGNNDTQATTASQGWDSVHHYFELREDGYHLILCHYAFRTWNQMGKKSINLHGHSHGRLKPLPRQFDVGVDAQELRPVSLDEILHRKEVGASTEIISEA